MLTAINPSCDFNCTADPYFKKFVLLYEPPPGSVPDGYTRHFSKAPGVVVAGQHMSSQAAYMHVWDALVAADVHTDPEVWSAIQGGTPGAAWEVNAVQPSGLPWDYYLVPILSDATTAIAFVQFAAEDGGFEGIYVPATPVSFTPVTMTHAAQLARGALTHGEHLTGGLLTWDPSDNAPITKSPSLPYYEFGVIGAGKQDVGVVRVKLDDRTVVRSQ